MSAELQWGAPPANKGHRGEVAAFVDALMERPGEWARYPHTMISHATAVLNRKRFPGTEWASRRRDDGRFDIYGRWIGVSE